MIENQRLESSRARVSADQDKHRNEDSGSDDEHTDNQHSMYAKESDNEGADEGEEGEGIGPADDSEIISQITHDRVQQRGSVKVGGEEMMKGRKGNSKTKKQHRRGESTSNNNAGAADRTTASTRTTDRSDTVTFRSSVPGESETDRMYTSSTGNKREPHNHNAGEDDGTDTEMGVEADSSGRKGQRAGARRGAGRDGHASLRKRGKNFVSLNKKAIAAESLVNMVTKAVQEVAGTVKRMNGRSWLECMMHHG